MGLAKLNIWVSGMDDPCSVDNRTWYVTIYNCDGEVLRWCDKTYAVLPAKCGHLEVEVPPGCYYIKAVWSFSFLGGVYYVNHFTDAAIVQACCESTTCVKLFNPSLHRCGTIVIRAIHDAVAQKGLKEPIARDAVNALNAVIAEIPPPKRLFELAHLDQIEKEVKKLEGKRK